VNRDIEIKGGAGEFEATVIAVVIDRISREEEAARQGRGRGEPGMSAWVRAIAHEDPRLPRDQVWPD
jgi:hypothetical protein